MAFPLRQSVWAVASVVAAGALAAGLVVRERAAVGGGGPRPLVVYAAASLRPPFTRIAADYEADTGRRVELRFGASEDILARVRLPNAAEPADLFAPADESYLTDAAKHGLIADSRPVARMHAVLLVAPGKGEQFREWSDFTSRDARVSLANAGAAIGRLTRQRLTATGRWPELEPRAVGAGTVTDSANAAKVGAADAAVVWDAVARNYPDQTVRELPELVGIEAEVRVATLRQSRDTAEAARFLRFVTHTDHGLKRFRECGFRVAE
jgi:molybdenum ABC transporter molybdate-binding protein